ncbi:MAG: hypothetical protein ACMZ66_17905 [Thalassospira sp.]|uniref:hypothetical protein n=1 Tax=Thalassospira sp. TaxID=1912094 RepID=UPI003A87A812
MNILNLFHAARDFLFPVLMMAAVLLGAALNPASAQVYSPNGVELSPAEWNEKSGDANAVTVRDALTNSANAMIKNGVKGVGGFTLTVLSFWSDSSNGDELTVEIRRNGSVQGNCLVSSTKVGTAYQTTC